MVNLFETVEALGASGYLFRIMDNGGATADRYTVAFCDGDALALSRAPSNPQGVSMWVENMDPATLAEWKENGQAVDLQLGDLPEHIRRHILARVNEAWGAALGSVELIDRNRDAAEINEGLHDSGGKGIYRDQFGTLAVRLEGWGDDRGPFTTAAEALRATLPDEHGLAGPEFHAPNEPGSLNPTPPGELLKQAIDALDALEDWGHAEPDEIEAAKERVGICRADYMAQTVQMAEA